MLEKYAKQITLALIALILLLILCQASNLSGRNLLGWVEGFRTPSEGFRTLSEGYRTLSEGFDNPTTTSPTYCPGQHPKVPCSSIKTCATPTTTPHISQEDTEIIDRYLYLQSLLESLNFFDKNPDEWNKI